jgi:hypothetical protein
MALAPTEPKVSPTPDHSAHVHVPRLAYRNSQFSDYLTAGSRHSTSTNGRGPTSNTAAIASTVVTSPSEVEIGLPSPGLSILTSSSSHSSTSRSPTVRSSGMSASPQLVKSKKKNSFLGTLFTKEPSTDAFVQMQNESRKHMAENPGRINPPGMSGVSSFKIPEHVPKVNSKWDGMPQKGNDHYDHTKRDSSTNSRGSSSKGSSTRSRSVGPNRRGSHSRHLSGSTNISKRSGHTRSRSSARQDEKRADMGEATRAAENVSSSNGVRDARPKSMSIRSQTLRSSSGSSLPYMTSFFPNDIPEPPGMPQMAGGQALTQPSVKASSERNSRQGFPGQGDNGLGTSPHHVSSPVSTPLELSPITPSSEPVSLHLRGHPVSHVDDLYIPQLPDADSTEPVFRSSGSHLLDPSAPTRKVSKESVRGFLAGEARPLQVPDDNGQTLTIKSILKNGNGGRVFAPSIQVQDLEKRPDSSRARLGLRASIIRDPSAAPWEWNKKKDKLSEASNRTSISRNLLPKSLGMF